MNWYLWESENLWDTYLHMMEANVKTKKKVETEMKLPGHAKPWFTK